MAVLLIIDTAMEQGGVGFFRKDVQLGTRQNASQKDHAAFVQTAIDELEQATQLPLEHIDAVAVVAGPGSYTGLRVGLATAKGLCYALDKKLILVNTLNVMAHAAIRVNNANDCYYAPMIDARRDDVFTGVYDNQAQLLLEQQALTITPDTFHQFSKEKKLALVGSGATKASRIITSDNIIVSESPYELSDINTIAQKNFDNKEFADVAYSEPDYLKAFHSTAKIQA